MHRLRPGAPSARRDDTFRGFCGVVRVTVPTKVAACPFLDLVASVRNGGSRARLPPFWRQSRLGTVWLLVCVGTLASPRSKRTCQRSGQSARVTAPTLVAESRAQG